MRIMFLVVIVCALTIVAIVLGTTMYIRRKLRARHDHAEKQPRSQ